MLNLYRRHTPQCPHREKGQNYTRCSCPIWCDGHLNGERFRRAVGVRDWARAVKRVEKWEKDPVRFTTERTVREAVDDLLSDCRARQLGPSTLKNYTAYYGHLVDFCKREGVEYVDEINLEVLTRFRAARHVKPATSVRELEMVRAFCAFAVAREWIPKNYGKALRPPVDDRPPTMPFTFEETEKILEACDKLTYRSRPETERVRRRCRAFILLLLYSGLRISDAVALKREAVDLTTGRLLLRVMKTGVPLYVRLGEPACEALGSLPEGNPEYFFWTGIGKLDTVKRFYRKLVYRVLDLAGIKGYPHRFRDTFSVRLLEKGEDLRTVQLLLGHTSLKTTEKHYAPFVRSFQARLDAATSKLDFGTKFGTAENKAGKLLKIG